MGPKKKEPPEGKGGKDGAQKDQGSESGGKGGKGKGGDLPPVANQGSPPPEEEQLPPEEPFCPPAVVTPEFVYNTAVSLEELQEIYALSDTSLEDAARKLAVILGLGDCVFDARNLILLEYCLGNLMFAKQAGFNLNQSLEIYDLGHMVVNLIRAEKPFGEAERLFKNRLISRSIVQYKTVSLEPIEKENDQAKENNQPKNEDEHKDPRKPKETTKKSKEAENPKEGKKSKKGESSYEADKLEEASKSKKDDKSNDANNPTHHNKVDEPKKDDKQEEPLFSHLDLKKITPYFISTVFQHYCLYQYCFTRVHYNIRRTEKVFVKTSLTYPLFESKSQLEVEEEEAAQVVAQEKAIQDAYTAQWQAKKSIFDSIAIEAKRLANEELARKALTLDEYIERVVRHKLEEAKKELIEAYEYREHFLIDKILYRQMEEEATHITSTTRAPITVKNVSIADKVQPIGAPSVVEKKKKKKGKQA